MNTLKQLPANAKVWIYQSNRPFTSQEIATINTDARQFLDNWQSHGQPMDAAFQLFFNQLFVIALDESRAGASGCGIDKSVHFIKNLEQKLNVDFFNRLNICYTNNAVDDIYDCNANILQVQFSNLQSINITNNTFIFDNTISTKQQLETQWLKPIGDSWLSNYINANSHS